MPTLVRNGESHRKRSFVLFCRLALTHDRYRFTELEDARADRALVEGSRAATGVCGTRDQCIKRYGSTRFGVRLFLRDWRWVQSGLEPQLELRLGSTDKRLENGRVGGVKDNISSDRIRISFEYDSLRWFDGEEMTKLEGRKRQLSGRR